MKVQKALPAHFPKLKGQAAALYPQIVRKLLPGKGDIEFIAPQPLGLGREVGHQLGPGAALAHVGELFTEAQIFFCKLAQQVPDDPAVVNAGGGTHVQDACHVQKHHDDGGLRHDTHIQPGAQAKAAAKVCPGPALERILRFPQMSS